jgi:hypothetical protein
MASSIQEEVRVLSQGVSGMRHMRTCSELFVVLLLATACASVEPVWPNLEPLLSAEVDSDSSLAERFPDFRKAPVDRGADGSTEGVYRTLSTTTTNGATPSSVEVSVRRFALVDSAESYRRRVCGLYATGFSRSDIRTSQAAGESWCSSPIQQLQNDPEGGRLPSGQYAAFAVVRRGKVVLSFRETRAAGSGSALDAVVRDMSHRLATPQPGSKD